jgi:hypothetical protein
MYCLTIVDIDDLSIDCCGGGGRSRSAAEKQQSEDRRAKRRQAKADDSLYVNELHNDHTELSFRQRACVYRCAVSVAKWRETKSNTTTILGTSWPYGSACRRP